MNKRWILRTKGVKDFCATYIQELKINEDEPLLEVTLKLHDKNRSLEQNAMFHAWCGTIAERTGHSKAEIKDILIEMTFGAQEYLNLNGETRTRLKSTSGMSVSEMSELLERTIQLGIELQADYPEVTHE